jgi:hypothetical protein
MAINLYENQIPSLITWFNGFAGFRELQRRAERIEAKLKALGFLTPALDRRFQIQLSYMKIVRRNRLCRPIDLSDPANNRVLSLLAAVREAAANLSDKGKEELRARVVDAFGPDRDARELEHELRAFVHYKQAGFDVKFVDYEGHGQFDLMVSGPSTEFEVECKTIAESIGSPISVDESLSYFRAFKAVLREVPDFNESGIVTLTIPSRTGLSEAEIARHLRGFLVGELRERHEPDLRLEFDRKLEWERLVQSGGRMTILDEIAAHQVAQNPHMAMAMSSKRALLFCVKSDRRPRPIRNICERMKSASNQLSKTRPGVIWVHFLGLTEDEFRDVRTPRQGRDVTPFEIMGNYLFGSQNRRHVVRLRLSADAERPTPGQYQSFFYGPLRQFSASGPAYDLTSSVSLFAPNSTV